MKEGSSRKDGVIFDRREGSVDRLAIQIANVAIADSLRAVWYSIFGKLLDRCHL